MSSGKWASSTRRTTLSGDWPRRKNSILKRDGRRCGLRLPMCIDVATEVDHIEGHSDDPANLRAVCQPCHAHRSAQQGASASSAVRRARVAARRREPERHPGLCD